MGHGGSRRFAADLTRTSGSRNVRKAATISLLLVLTAAAARSAYRAWKKPFLSIRNSTDLECTAVFHPKNVLDYAKGSPRKPRDLQLHLLQKNPTLNPNQRPGFFQPYPHNLPSEQQKMWSEPTWRETNRIGWNLPSERKQPNL